MESYTGVFRSEKKKKTGSFAPFWFLIGEKEQKRGGAEDRANGSHDDDDDDDDD